MADELDVVVGDAGVRVLVPLMESDIASWRMVDPQRIDLLDSEGNVLASGNPGVIGANALSEADSVFVLELDALGPAAPHTVPRAA